MLSNYELNTTINQLYLGHCEKAKNLEETFGTRAFNTLMAGCQYPIVIGQIVGLFELAILKIISTVTGVPINLNNKNVKVVQPMFTTKRIAIISLVAIAVISVGYLYKQNYLDGMLQNLNKYVPDMKNIKKSLEKYFQNNNSTNSTNSTNSSGFTETSMNPDSFETGMCRLEDAPMNWVPSEGPGYHGYYGKPPVAHK